MSARAEAPRPEDELALLLCGTRARRDAAAGRIAQLAAEVGQEDFARVLSRHRIAGVAGVRLRDLGLLPDDPIRALVEKTLRVNTARTMLAEATVTRVVAALEDRGIAALPLKGLALARAIYPDPALRQFGDVDLLVPRDRLNAAAVSLAGLGYGEPRDALGSRGLPRLHLHVEDVRGRLLPVELHWRVHWFEETFSAAMLARSAMDGGTRQATRTDELATLLLVYARDGFTGLRLAADIAAWWDRFGDDLGPGALDELAAQHPELRVAWRAAADVAESVAGVPAQRVITAAGPPTRRCALAARLANWTLTGDADQVSANVTLVDALLSPPADYRFIRRTVLLSREATDDFYGLGPRDHLRRALWRIAHPPKLLMRYVLALNAVRGAGRWSPAVEP